MDNDSWREETLDLLTNILQPDKQVLSLSLFGSLANSEIETDRWSDIDALLIVDDAAFDKYTLSADWLAPLGKIFSIQLSPNVIKVIFDDFKKIDLVINTKSKIINEEPFWTKQKFVFSNSDEIKKILEEKALTTIANNPNSYDLVKLANEYWYISFTAVTKLIRNDLLISLHLALELYRICLILGMWLRDKEAGTYIHRTGGVRNNVLEKMNIKLEEMTKEGILNLIEQCGEEFDKLALEWSPDYNPHSPLFKKVLTEARKDLSS